MTRFLASHPGVKGCNREAIMAKFQVVDSHGCMHYGATYEAAARKAAKANRSYQ